MKQLFNAVFGWLLALALWLWSVIPKAIDWVGRSTLPDDWRQLMTEKLPLALHWLFSTPGWVPGFLAALLTGWLIWVSWPRGDVGSNSVLRLGATDQISSPDYGVEISKPIEPPAQTQSAVSKAKPQLPPYEIERKLKAIDVFLEMLDGKFQRFLDEWNSLPNLLYGGRYPDRFSEFRTRPTALVEGIKELTKDIEEERNRVILYNDIRSCTNPTFWNSATPKIDQFVEIFLLLGHNLKPETGKSDFLKLMQPATDDFHEAMKELEAWRNSVRGNLNDIRLDLTT
jgi:hypothetical protein